MKSSKWISLIGAIIVVGCSTITVPYILYKYWTGKHPDNWEFYILSIATMLLPILSIAIAWEKHKQYKEEKEKAS